MAGRAGVIQTGEENDVGRHLRLFGSVSGPIRKMGINLLAGPVTIRQGVMALNYGSVDLDWM